jgi:hypothetical protein
MNINFLARPEPGDVTAGARLMRLGRRQAVAEAELFSQGPRPHAIATYALRSPDHRPSGISWGIGLPLRQLLDIPNFNLKS